MSRPSTRSKNKKAGQISNADRTSEILRKVHALRDVKEDDINQLYNIGKPVCQGCRVNNKENPNCFCALIPSPNGSRKSGLWQKMSELVYSLGPDPSKDLRDSLNFPAGLTNLGATCYANSILQCLYMNTSFREGVFSIDTDVLKQLPVLDQLVRLFGQLHASKKAFIDSAPFIRTLELDNGVQQDSHEFLTLFLSLLERSLSNSRSSKARTIVQDLFRGSVSHVTTCSNCGKDSEASSKIEDFYELELNVMGLKGLDESLDDYLSLEELNGENQYFCESCKARVDATRSIKLCSLPKVLNIQLKRYVFLPKTTTKKKVTSAFSFPQLLDMRRRFSDPALINSVYELSAVLIHKGTAVNSGHYIAHIKDENTGVWWEFDDENVSRLGYHPFGEGLSGPIKQLDPQADKPHAEMLGVDEFTNHTSLNHQQMPMIGTSSHPETYSSSDAYMLMYTMKNSQEKPIVSCFDGTIVANGTTSVETDHLYSLPLYLREEINELNALNVNACQEYKLRKDKELGLITERRQEVRSILSEAPVQSSHEPYHWISTNWLRQWADSVNPLVLDNTHIQCSHGKVPISKVGSMKRLSAKAWNKLLSKYHGGPALTNCDYCMDCLNDAARDLVCGESYKDRRKLMKELVDSVLSGNCTDGTYYVSKAWLQQWVKRKITDAPTELDVGPTLSISCSHGRLMPEQAAGAKRLLVPENLWFFFYEDAVTVKTNDPLGCLAFPIDSEQCSECSNELSEVACLEDSLREMKNKQRRSHEKLAAGKNVTLYPSCQYYLLPSSWLAKWRNYINASGKNNSSTPVPETLHGVINQLRCEKHSRLLERPLDLVCKRGAIVQKVSNTDGLSIITEADWKFFCEEWGCAENIGISAIVDWDLDMKKKDGTDKEMLICEDQLSCHDGHDVRVPVLRTSPEVCEECIGERASCELMQRLNYSDGDITVVFVRRKEVPRSILEASETTFDPDRRISKRPRRTNYGSAVNLKVSGSTSIYQLKMMIWGSLGVVKENQEIHKGQMRIEGESGTLADFNIFPGDTLWVRDSKIHEYRDIADEISDPKMDVQNVEEGFRGTLLMADFSS